MDQEQPGLLDSQRPSCEVLTPKKPESAHFMAEEEISDKKKLGKSRRWPCFRSWAPEALWCLAASCLLALLVLALRQFDGKAQPNWPFGLTLNTVVAFLSTVCRSIMIIPVTEGLLQLKWNWYAGNLWILVEYSTAHKAAREVYTSGSMGNVTEHLTKDDVYMVLPRGLGRLSSSLNITSPGYRPGTSSMGNTSDPTPLYKWENLDILPLSIAQAFFLYEVPIEKYDERYFEAVEVIWHYCVHTYNITVTDNIAETSVLESETGLINKDREYGPYVLLDKSGQNRFNLSCSYNVNDLRWRIPSTFVGDWSYINSPLAVRVNEFTHQIGMNLFSSVVWPSTRKPLEQSRPMMWTNLRNITETMAQAMTEYMRTTQVNGTIIGEALDSEIFITVRWAWLSFLAAQIALTVVFLLAVAEYTFRLGVPVMKGSNLAEPFAIRKSDVGTTTHATVNGKQNGINQTIDEPRLGILVREYDGWILEIQSKE